MSRNLPIKISTQLQFLIALSLFFALGASVLTGSAILQDDKKAYIYDLSLARVTAGAHQLEAQLLARTFRVLQAATRQEPKGTETNSPDAFLAFEVPSDVDVGALTLDREGGPQAERTELRTWLEQAKVSLPVSGEGPARPALFADSKGSPIVALSPATGKVILFRWKIQTEGLSGFSLHDSKGLRVSDFGRSEIPGEQTWLSQLPADAVGSGVREWKSTAGEVWLIGYQRIASGQLLAVGAVSREEAFASIGELRRRTIFLGVSVFLLSLGLAALVSNRLSRRIRLLWETTSRMAAGDLKARAAEARPGKLQIRDEVSHLSGAFNEMAGKLELLVQEKEVKARMEKELETAQLIQRQFLPKKAILEGPILVGGSALPANECGGDWWGYHQTDRYLIIAIGDVTGHGAQSALVTAAAHGAFSILMQEIDRSPEKAPEPGVLIERINAALVSDVSADIAMTFSCSVVDFKTLEMVTANAAHRPALIFDPIEENGSDGKSPLKGLHPLVDAAGTSLGEGVVVQYATTRKVLVPGSLLLWYTDGLVECETPEGQHWHKKDLARSVREAWRETPDNPEKIAENILKKNLDFLHKGSLAREDDITIVIGLVAAYAAAAAPRPGLAVSEAAA